jgi:N-formylglutamate amidohydrolase
MIDFDLRIGKSRLMVAAIHNGHRIRPELLPYLNLTDKEREKEEDPYTAELTSISDNSLNVFTSRFEVDINRPREKSVYQKPDDAWGYTLYNQEIPAEMVKSSLQYYDEFYKYIHRAFKDQLAKHPWLIVYDLHSYNHRRGGIDNYEDPEDNPEINLGTGNIDLDRWGGVVNCLHQTLSEYNFEGRNLDVRENIKFKGGYFTKWLSMNFGKRVCPIAIEFKKFFMDEWSGEVNQDQLDHIRQLLISTIQPVIKEADLNEDFHCR